MSGLHDIKVGPASESWIRTRLLLGQADGFTQAGIYLCSCHNCMGVRTTHCFIITTNSSTHVQYTHIDTQMVVHLTLVSTLNCLAN